MNQSSPPSAARTSSIVSQSPTASKNDTSNSYIICRFQFPTLLNSYPCPTDNCRSPSADNIVLLTSNNDTSPMDVPPPFEVDDELTNPLKTDLFPCACQLSTLTIHPLQCYVSHLFWCCSRIYPIVGRGLLRPRRC